VYLEATTRLYEPWGSVWRRNIQVTQKSVRVNELGRSLYRSYKNCLISSRAENKKE